MTSIATFTGSSVGKKVLMAITGLMLFGFVMVHLLGNLTLFIPDEGKAFNEYGHFLETVLHGWLIIAFEVGLIAIILVHMIYAIIVAWIDKEKARPQKYAMIKNAGGKSRKSLASRSMILTGPVILIFIILHVKMFKFAAHPPVVYHGTEMKNLFAVVVEAFKVPWITAAYVAVMVLLGFHLWHGVWSAFQSMGWNSDRHIKLLTRLSWAAGFVLGAGFLALPLYIHFFVSVGTEVTSMSASKILDAKIPAGPLAEKWDRHAMDTGLVAPANRRKFKVIVVGTGLAGGGAAATLGEMGFNVINLCINDTSRRAHSVAAQGGINAAKNYQNDGDSIERLFYDTIKGGDYRSREANVYRLAQLSTEIIDQCVAMGVPFAREYGGTLANRSFGGVQVSRTFYARGQTGQQLLLGVYSALSRQVKAGTVKMYSRHEMLDLVIENGRAVGVICRDLVSGEMRRFAADAVVLATGGYSPVYFLSTNAVNCNATAAWRSHKRGAFFSNPCFTQIHPTAIPQAGDYQSKLTLMSESLRNDGRVWVPKKPGDKRAATDIPEDERDYYLERRYPAFGNLVPRDIAARAAKKECDAGKGVGNTGFAVNLDFADAIERLGKDVVGDRYGNLFDMYEEISDENPYKTPMRIYPAPHYTMGGLWVDYNLMSTIPGLFVAGEANFSDHGANRLGASALMQGLADGYFVVPRVVAGYLASAGNSGATENDAPFAEVENEVKTRYDKLLSIQGTKTVRDYWWDLGRIMWDKVGMSRNTQGLKEAIQEIGTLRQEYWQNVKVPGNAADLNKHLEMAGRVADFFEIGELMARDALMREESCGGHFREEYQTEEGEALRDDKDFTFVSAWEHKGDNQEPVMHKEDLVFENVELKTRSYK